MNIDDFVHQLNNGRWIVAVWSAGAYQWHAPMNATEKRVTNCETYFARTLEGLGVHNYARKRDAVHFAQSYYAI